MKRIYLLLSLIGLVLKTSAGVVTGTFGASATYSLDTDSGVLTVSGTGETVNNASYETSPLYPHQAEIKSIVVSEGITQISANSFYRCTSLTSVTLPASLVCIDDNAFAQCTSLASFTIPSGVTSLGGGYGPFAGCDDLTHITIISQALVDGSIQRLTDKLPGGMTHLIIGEGITTIGDNALPGVWNQSKLETLTLPSTLTTIGRDAFNAHNGPLTQLTIPAGVTTIGNGAFTNCRSLKKMTIESVRLIEKNYTPSDRFNQVFPLSLETIILPEGLTQIGSEIFGYMYNLDNITIPAGVTYIGSGAFAGCNAMKTVTMLPLTPPTVFANTFTYAFTNDNSDSRIYVPDEAYETYKDPERFNYFYPTVYRLSAASIGQATVSDNTQKVSKHIEHGRVVISSQSADYSTGGAIIRKK